MCALHWPCSWCFVTLGGGLVSFSGGVLCYLKDLPYIRGMENVASKVAGGAITAVVGIAGWFALTVHNHSVAVVKIETEVLHIEEDVAEIKAGQAEMLDILHELQHTD